MGRNKLKAIALVICTISIFSIMAAGCGQSSLKAEIAKDKRLRINFVSPMVGHPVWLGAKEGMDAAAKEFGFSGVWMGADDHSLEKTLEALEQAVAERPDGIVCYPFSPSAFKNVLIKAKAANIPVTVVAADAENKGLRTAFVGTNCVEWGKKHTEALYKKAGDPFKVGVIMSNLDAENQVIAVNQLKEFVKNTPGAQIVDIQEDQGNQAKAIETFRNMVKAHPDMNALFGTEGSGAPGFAKVLEELKLLDKVAVISMDDTEQNLSVVREGKIYGIMAQNFYKMGYLGSKYAWEAALGRQVPAETDSGVTLVTRENVSTYKQNR